MLIWANLCNTVLKRMLIHNSLKKESKLYIMNSKFETIDNDSQLFSLIKYEPPIDITQKLEAYQKAKLIERTNQSKPSPQDILNTILPPREWKNSKNEYYMQYVSHQRPEREDVERLQKQLDLSLLKKQARLDAICPIRQYTFSQVFDELIRQATLDNTERGLMLLRVRDQRKMTIAAYQAIYQEAKSYCMKKQYESQEGMEDLEGNLTGLQNKFAELEKKKYSLLSKKASMAQNYRQKGSVESQRRQYELSSLAKQNKFLENFLNSRKKVVIEQKAQESEQQI